MELTTCNFIHLVGAPYAVAPPQHSLNGTDELQCAALVPEQPEVERSSLFLLQRLKKSLIFHQIHAGATEHRTISSGLKRHNRLSMASMTGDGSDCGRVLPERSEAGQASAARTSPRLIFEFFQSIKFLLARREEEFLRALFANQGFIRKFHMPFLWQDYLE